MFRTSKMATVLWSRWIIAFSQSLLIQKRFLYKTWDWDEMHTHEEDTSECEWGVQSDEGDWCEESNGTGCCGAEQLARPIHYITKRPLNESVPQDWKTAYIMSIYKGGDKENQIYYRPVYLTV